MLVIHQWVDARSQTRTYVVVDPMTNEAVVVDPVRDQHPRDIAALRDLGVHVVGLLETHVHADHVTGASLLQDALPKGLGTPPVFVSKHAHVRGDAVLVGQGDKISLGVHSVEVRETPGHTEGCLSFVVPGPVQGHDGEELSGAVFCGDTLLIDGCGRTDFQGGSAQTLYQSVQQQLFTLDDTTRVYPAHDYKGRSHSSIGEQRRTNARLRDGIDEATFVAIMDALVLAHPAQIDVAVPANQMLGDLDKSWLPLEPKAGPLGVPEISVDALDPKLGTAPAGLIVVDVRPQAERDRDGELPHTIFLPLDDVKNAVRFWSRKAPLLVVCQVGERSANATRTLLDLGFRHVANLRGGMMAFLAAATGVATDEHISVDSEVVTPSESPAADDPVDGLTS